HAPPADAPGDHIQQYKMDMMHGPDEGGWLTLGLSENAVLSGFGSRGLSDIARWPGLHFGFGPGDVEQSLVTDFNKEPTSGAQEVIVGQMSPTSARESLAACDECPEHETATYAGQEYFVWGEDLEGNLRQRLGPPAFDQFGRGGRVHVGEGHAARTLTHAQMEELIDAASGDAPALDDEEDFVLVARAMDTFGATSATMVRQPFTVDHVIESLGGEEHMEQMDGLRFDVVLREYAASAAAVPQPGAVATGVRVGDDGRHSLIAALVFDDPDTAEQAELAILERLTADMPPTTSVSPDDLGRLLETVAHGRVGRVVLLDVHGEWSAVSTGSMAFHTFFGQGPMVSRIFSPLLVTEAHRDS
ncbi:MAG: hypothetical protein ACOC5K_04530, partial [Chloroflexota bacterium]